MFPGTPAHIAQIPGYVSGLVRVPEKKTVLSTVNALIKNLRKTTPPVLCSLKAQLYFSHHGLFKNPATGEKKHLIEIFTARNSGYLNHPDYGFQHVTLVKHRTPRYCFITPAELGDSVIHIRA